MSNETHTHERVRIFITGDCEGLGKLSENLTAHADLDLIGTAEHGLHRMRICRRRCRSCRPPERRTVRRAARISGDRRGI